MKTKKKKKNHTSSLILYLLEEGNNVELHEKTINELAKVEYEEKCQKEKQE